MMIYRAGQKTPPGFSLKGEGNMNMNKSRAAKIIKISLSAVSAFALTVSTVHAGAANQVSPSTNSFSSIGAGSSSSLNGNSTFVASPTFGLPAGPVTSAPVHRNIRPVFVSRPVGVPDSGSTAVFLALSLFGLFLMGRKLVKT